MHKIMSVVYVCLFSEVGRGGVACSMQQAACSSLRPLSTSMFAQDASTLGTGPGHCLICTRMATLSKFCTVFHIMILVPYVTRRLPLLLRDFLLKISVVQTFDGYRNFCSNIIFVFSPREIGPYLSNYELGFAAAKMFNTCNHSASGEVNHIDTSSLRASRGRQTTQNITN